MTEIEYLTAISVFTYFGPARIRLLISYFKKAKNVWMASNKELIEIGLSVNKVNEFDNFRKNFEIEKYFQSLEKEKINVVTYLDTNFPKALNELNDCPAVLYYKGTLDCLDKPTVAIVGSRKMTSYGKEVAEKFAGELGSFGITIVSGLAHGIDTVAHKSCVSVGGTTAAVLGCGLDQIYPSENKNLSDEIINKKGILISEYPLGYPALPVNFAIRNRIVSGLSSCVVVIEGEEKSGTLLTATHAANQGKTVFAVPGNIMSPLSKAPLFLLKNGARIATEPKDILDELNIETKIDRVKMRKISPDNKEEEKILEFLNTEPLLLDELVRISKCKTSEISARLTIMEMKGLVKNLGGGKYKKN